MRVGFKNSVLAPIVLRPEQGKTLKLVCYSGESSTTLIQNITWIEISEEYYDSLSEKKIKETK